jgi:hypothetical protein
MTAFFYKVRRPLKRRCHVWTAPSRQEDFASFAMVRALKVVLEAAFDD